MPHGIALDVPLTTERPLDDLFRQQYPRVCRIVARVIHDRGRAEELAVDVFLRFERGRTPGTGSAEGWLYRTAVRAGLDELRRQARHRRYEQLARVFSRAVATPEDEHATREVSARVRAVLAALKRREAELLVLRNEGLSYQEVAVALRLNPASVGTLLARAERAFKREYVRRYGEQ